LLAFVVLGLVSSVPSQEISWEERHWNDLFCVEWDAKPELNQSIPLQAHTDSIGQWHSNEPALPTFSPMRHIRHSYHQFDLYSPNNL